jgi:hypothetical protein
MYIKKYYFIYFLFGIKVLCNDKKQEPINNQDPSKTLPPIVDTIIKDKTPIEKDKTVPLKEKSLEIIESQIKDEKNPIEYSVILQKGKEVVSIKNPVINDKTPKNLQEVCEKNIEIISFLMSLLKDHIIINIFLVENNIMMEKDYLLLIEKLKLFFDNLTNIPQDIKNKMFLSSVETMKEEFILEYEKKKYNNLSELQERKIKYPFKYEIFSIKFYEQEFSQILSLLKNDLSIIKQDKNINDICETISNSLLNTDLLIENLGVNIIGSSKKLNEFFNIYSYSNETSNNKLLQSINSSDKKNHVEIIDDVLLFFSKNHSIDNRWTAMILTKNSRITNSISEIEEVIKNYNINSEIMEILTRNSKEIIFKTRLYGYIDDTVQSLEIEMTLDKILDLFEQNISILENILRESNIKNNKI